MSNNEDTTKPKQVRKPRAPKVPKSTDIEGVKPPKAKKEPKAPKAPKVPKRSNKPTAEEGDIARQLREALGSILSPEQLQEAISKVETAASDMFKRNREEEEEDEKYYNPSEYWRKKDPAYWATQE